MQKIDIYQITFDDLMKKKPESPVQNCNTEEKYFWEKQYKCLKKSYPKHILLFKVGDFYESFFEDANTVSNELDLVLTGKWTEKGNRCPMVGFPIKTTNSYVSKLVNRGYKVAIASPIEENKIDRFLF